MAVSDGVLQSLQVPPAAGRWLSKADQEPHARRKVMLSWGYWQRRFGGAASAIGSDIMVDAQSREIAERACRRDFASPIPTAI